MSILQTNQTRDLLSAVQRFSKTKKLKFYIVGGFLRDFLLKRSRDNPDIDFAIKEGAIKFGKELSRELRAGFVVLDKEHGACRLVKKIKDKAYTLDFTDFRGPTLEDDLGKRDFTINALALELGEVFKPQAQKLFIDPCFGQKDLKKKLIKAASRNSFSDDPLRLLRAFSFACLFNFKIDKETLNLIKLQRNSLANTSYERIRDELFKILDSPRASFYLPILDKLKLLEIIFPEIKKMRGIGRGAYHHLDVWDHSLETVRQLEAAVGRFKKNKEVCFYLDEIISGGRKRLALLKLAALLHDVGKPCTLRRQGKKIKFYGHEAKGAALSAEIARRLKLSNDELNALKVMVLWHLRPGYLADSDTPTSRAVFRYFRDASDESVSVLLLSLADQRATCGPLTTKESACQHEKVVLGLIRAYFRKKKEKKAKRLLNGDELMEKFQLKPSPLVGKILAELEELQAIGKIKTKQSAYQAAKAILKNGS